MKKVDRTELMQTWLRASADVVGLKDWTIEFDPEPLEEANAELGNGDYDSDADNRVTDGCLSIIRVHAKFWAKPPEEQREIMAHELGHCHTWMLDKVVELVQAGTSKSVAAVVKEAQSIAEEHLVERFARVIAPLLPLPPSFQ